MRNLILGAIIGLLIGYFIKSELKQVSETTTKLTDSTESIESSESIYSLQDYVPRPDGESSKEVYRHLPKRKQMFGTLNDTLINALYFSPEGFRQLVDSPIFKGLCIDLGSKKVNGKDRIQLLICGLKQQKNADGSYTVERYYLKNPGILTTSTNENYLDKSCPCPLQGTSCPCQQ